MLNKLKMLKKQGDEGKNTFLYQSKHTVVHLSNEDIKYICKLSTIE